MTRVAATLVLLACVVSPPAIGQPDTANEAVLLKARQALGEAKDLVADSVVTDMEMIDGDGKSMGTMHIEEKFSGWADGEPVRTIVANSNPENAPVARARFKVTVDNHPEKGLREGATFERINSVLYDGRPCGVFAMTGTSGKASFKSKIWIEEATGRPLKVVHDFDGIPMTKSMQQTIIYDMNKDGAWVPASAMVDATVGILFQKMRVISKYRFLNWIRRPALP